MQSFWRLLGWLVVVEALITIFGVTTGPLMLALAADVAVGLLIVRSCLDIRDSLPVSPSAGEKLRQSEGAR